MLEQHFVPAGRTPMAYVPQRNFTKRPIVDVGVTMPAKQPTSAPLQSTQPRLGDFFWGKRCPKRDVRSQHLKLHRPMRGPSRPNGCSIYCCDHKSNHFLGSFLVVVTSNSGTRRLSHRPYFAETLTKVCQCLSLVYGL
jgi:hypothetical protein